VKRLSAPKDRQRGRMRLAGIAAAMRGRVRGRPEPSGGGGGGATGLRAAINLPGPSQYNSVFPYRDLIKHTEVLWTSAAFPGGIPRNNAILNANHFPTAIPAGTSATLLVWYALGELRSTVKFPAGNYKILWTPVNGASVSFSGTGITSVVGGTAGTATFTASSASTDGFLTVTAAGGSAGGADNIKIVRTDHEAGLLAGDALHPDFVAELQSWTNLESVRFLDFLAANYNTVVNAADWTTLGYQSYTRSDRGCPPEIIGQVGAKLASTVALWPMMPRTATNAAMVDFFTKIKAAEPSGTRLVHCEGINESWNAAFPSYSQLGNTDYIGLDVRDFNGNPSTAFNDRLTAAYMHHAMRTWTACESVFGAARTIRTVGVQTGWYDFMRAWPQYRDVTGSNLYGGATGLALMNQSSGRPKGQVCMSWYFYSYNGTSIKQRIKDDFGAQTDAFCKAAWVADIDNDRINNWLPQVNGFRGVGYTGDFTTYEGACHDFWDKHDNSTGRAADFYGTVNTGNNTVEFVAEGTAWIASGDLMITPNQTMTSPAIAFPNFFYVRKTGTNAIRVYATLGAYTADSGNTGAGAATLIAGTYYFANQTRFARFSDKLQSIFTGTIGQELFQYVADATLKHPTIQAKAMNLFVAMTVSRDSNGRFSYSFDAHNKTAGDVQTPAITYLKGLTGA
jgi:hypothetical protein